MSKEVKGLNTVNKLDAMARIARAMTQFTKPESIALDYTVLEKEGIAMILSFGMTLQGFETLQGTDFVPIEETNYSVSVVSIVKELDKFGINVQALNAPKDEALATALKNKVYKSIFDVLSTLDLMPLTRKRRAKKAK